MAQPINWYGANKVLTAPEGREGDIQSMSVFNNGLLSVSCWELTKDEIMDIIQNRCIFIGIIAGESSPPIIVGTEDHIRRILVDYGKVWKKGMITPEQLAKSGSEHGHQSALFCWVGININKYPDLVWLFAIPNGGLRDKITAGKLKASGVKSGVPDICLPIRRGSYSGLFIEMKRGKNKPTAEQKEWINFLPTQGFGVIVCYDWEAARDIIIQYLEHEK